MNRRVRVGLLAFLGLVVLLAAPARLRAQGFDLELVDAGKPVPNSEVLLLVDATRVPLGSTDASGHLAVANRADIPRGTPVDVYEIECDGEVIIVIVGPGEREQLDEECERRRRENPNCACRRIGGFLWGDDVTIDVGRGTVTSTLAGEPPADAGHAFADVQLGVVVDYSTFYNWEDVGCDQPGIESCSGDTGVLGGGVYLDYRFGDSPFGLNLEAHYAKLDIDQTFQPDDDLPLRNSGEVDSWLFQGGLVYSHGFSPDLAWFARLGYAVLHDSGEFMTTYADGPLTESRDNTASQLLLGTGLHFPVSENWCVRTGVDLTTSFDSGNGDENVRVSFGVGYRMNRE